MLHHLRDLKGYEVVGADHAVGAIYDFLFDEGDWIVRYVVIDTGGWLSGRRLLLSAAAVDRIDETNGRIHFSMTREQIENGPPLESADSISRNYEAELASYYGWPEYWGARAMETAAVGPPPVPAHRAGTAKRNAHGADLRSVNAVSSYDLHGLDGRIGKVKDFLCEDYEWCIRYIVVDTGGWLTGRLVLVSPTWIDDVDWRAMRVHLELTRAQIEASPECDPSVAPAREYEERLHQHYGRERYWIPDRNSPAMRL